MTTIDSERLVIRPWEDADAADALAIYGDEKVTHWLSPVMSRVPDVTAMRSLLQKWQENGDPAPAGHWAVVRRDTSQLIGGVGLLHLPPWQGDLELAWQLAPSAWGHGYAAEAGSALVRWAMHQGGVDEVFAVVRPDNTRGAATAQRIGMEWIGETDKYHDMNLHLYRIRHYDLSYR
ncbi:GNAT family N-acetyltransferase [Kribbella sp. VKM Ac-2568]|uniref:GNAT family N-acetyltransferase n=1 Tax=Kribbella sp. VKM Ac-2568 TaxID=2512219 RepID=UPI00104B79E6|nr:GNAT family N-acetyltransferase [Kribbella sp. VKM Ac-2568]TCM44504.1 RimJ/RimL family protein N-acetyltransferase [Kribbella sp. VKM Ac-2568]